MIDFTKCKKDITRAYGGANGNKICVIYEDMPYMLKFPPKAKHNADLSYANSCISEYISCKILKSIGMNVQEVLLGTYQDKVVVACKDFVGENERFLDFAAIKNTVIDSMSNGYGTELFDILDTIHNQELLDSKTVKKFFWDMFICDAFLGNFDRHNGNWGFLVNTDTKNVRIAPIYDCGSCLFPQNTDEGMRSILQDKVELMNRVYARPLSAIKVNDVKINYFNYLQNTTNIDCIHSLLDIGKRFRDVDLTAILDSVPVMTDIHKEFLQSILSLRKEYIIEKSIERVETIVKESVAVISNEIKEVEEYNLEDSEDLEL